MRIRIAVLGVTFLVSFILRTGVTQSPRLVKDVETTSRHNPSSDPAGFVSYKGMVYFTARTKATGEELYRSTNQRAKTRLFADLVIGPRGSAIRNLTALPGGLVFTAQNAQYKRELWRTDGTTSGTTALPWLARPRILCTLGSMALLEVWHPSSGSELWRTDGTVGGTVPVKDINPGPADSSLKLLGVSSGIAYFSANDGTNGAEFWRSDGTSSGTKLVADLSVGPTSSNPHAFGAIGRYFVVAAGSPPVLIATDGTRTGTYAIQQLVPHVQPVTAMVAFRGGIYFTQPGGVGLAYTDGLVNGVKQVTGAPAISSSPIVVNNTLFFVGSDNTNGTELWESDGVSALPFADMPGPQGSAPMDLTVFKNHLYWRALQNPASGPQLLRTNNTFTGAVVVKGTRTVAGVRGLVVAGNGLWLAADDGIVGNEPYVSDGTARGTRLAADIASPDPGSRGSLAAPVADLFGRLLFTARRPSGQLELHISDGTTAGTRHLKTLAAQVLDPWVGSALLADRAVLLVAERVGTNMSVDLWVTDGTTTGTRYLRRFLISALNLLRDPVVMGGRAFFIGDDGVTGPELWVTDGTPGGTTLVRDVWPGPSGSYPVPLAAIRGSLFFSAATPQHGGELWVTNGTVAGTRLVRDIHPGTNSSFPRSGIAFQGRLMFGAGDGTRRHGIWQSDGTARGTTQVFEPLPAGSVDGLRVIGSRFAFLDNNGTWLYASDGTTAGTVRLGEQLINRDHPVDTGSYGLFGSRSGLWRTDGTVVKTRAVHPVAPQSIVPTGSRHAFFFGRDSQGSEPWWTDGTTGGTRRLADLFPGSTSGAGWNARSILSGGLVYFAADDGIHGQELWAFDPGASTKPLGHGCTAYGFSTPRLRSTDPVLGGRCSFTVSDAPVGASGYLLASAGYRPGMRLRPGCVAYIDPAASAVLRSTPNVTTVWVSSIAIPSTPALTGLKYTAQAFFLPGRTAFDATNAVHLRLGG